MTHTPGPWSIAAENNVCHQIDGEYHAICTDQFCFAPEIEKAANARLIAAAPDMLALAIRAETMLPMIGDIPAVKRLIEDLRAAIAKATGAA